MLLSRGNLGLDVPPEKGAIVQKAAINSCNLLGKPVVITRVVDTMATAPRCTRLVPGLPSLPGQAPSCCSLVTLSVHPRPSNSAVRKQGRSHRCCQRCAGRGGWHHAGRGDAAWQVPSGGRHHSQSSRPQPQSKTTLETLLRVSCSNHLMCLSGDCRSPTSWLLGAGPQHLPASRTGFQPRSTL